MKKPIYERIISEAEREAGLLLEETKKEAREVFKSSKEDIIAKNTEMLNRTNEEAKQRVKSFEERQERGLLNYREQVRQELVVQVFDEVYRKLSALKGSELRAFIVKLIKDEDVNGSEKILVSSKNFAKYLAALSSLKDPAKLDLLTKENSNYTFVLSKTPTHVSEGFILSNDTYDLIFDFAEIVKAYQKKEEQRIYNELFEHEE